jgi:uncharacterized protein (DUF302 family)
MAQTIIMKDFDGPLDLLNYAGNGALEMCLLKEKGMTVFNRIKHSEAAAAVGIELRNTELILFGNPKVGSPLMKCQQSAAIDLPQKALIWEDDKATVWISYNNPRYLEKRHNITGCEEVISKIERALAGIAESAATK